MTDFISELFSCRTVQDTHYRAATRDLVNKTYSKKKSNKIMKKVIM
jgi:hypothetical protein